IGPDFSGKGSFTVDPGVTPGDFKGPLAKALFLSEPPALATVPVSLDVYLPLFAVDPTSPAQKVPLTAAQLKLDRSTGRGQVNGVIKKEDLDQAKANIASMLDKKVQMDPGSS